MTSSLVLGKSGHNIFFPFDPTHPKIQYLMNDPILGKIVQYKIMGFQFKKLQDF